MANNQIALMAQMPELDTPFESQGKALQLKQLMNAGQVQDMDMQQRRQAIADDAATRDIYAKTEDPAERIKALYRVNPKAAMTAQKAQLDLDKIGADVEESKGKAAQARLTAMNMRLQQARDIVGANVNDQQGAAQWVQGMYADKDIGPHLTQYLGPVEQMIKQIPNPAVDPKGFAEWKQASMLIANELVKQTTPDANARLSATTSLATNAATNATSIANSQRSAASSKYSADSSAGSASARLAFDKEKQASGGVEPSMSQETISRLAKQVIRGDRTGLANMGRGAQGAANLVAVQNAVTDEAVRQGMTPEQITAASASLEGLRTGMRATGNISARVENAAEEAAQLAPLALEASRQVSRSGLLPFGKAQIMFNTQTNDPALAKFATANLGLATAYASAMARGNKPTVSDNEHARKLLSEAQSQPAYEAKINQMMAEIEAAKRAPRVVRGHLTGEISGKGGHSSTPAIPAGWSVKER